MENIEENWTYEVIGKVESNLVEWRRAYLPAAQKNKSADSATCANVYKYKSGGMAQSLPTSPCISWWLPYYVSLGLEKVYTK